LKHHCLKIQLRQFQEAGKALPFVSLRFRDTTLLFDSCLEFLPWTLDDELPDVIALESTRFLVLARLAVADAAALGSAVRTTPLGFLPLGRSLAKAEDAVSTARTVLERRPRVDVRADSWFKFSAVDSSVDESDRRVRLLWGGSS
jgi:hypothetical protein